MSGEPTKLPATAAAGGRAAPFIRAHWKWMIGLLVIAAAGVLGQRFDLRSLLQSMLDRVQEWGPLGPIIFIATYVLAAVFFVPGSILTLGAGAVFGVVKGSLWVSLGSTAGATAAFLIGRYLARGWIARKIEGNKRFEAIDRAVGDQGWKIVGLIRLSPVFPFTLLNYAFGLTKVSLRDFVLASWIGMMPGTIMYVYLGSLAKVSVGDTEKTPGEIALYLVGLIATVGVTFYVTRLAKRALTQRITS